MKTHSSLKNIKLFIILLLTVALFACGGGGGQSPASGSSLSSATALSVDTAGQVQFALPNVTNACLGISSPSTSIGAWWVSGAFNVTNNCSTQQSASGLQVNISSNGYTLDPAQFQLYGQTGLYFPPPVYWAPTTGTFTKSGSGAILALNTSGFVPANSSVNFTYGYNPGGKLPGAFTYSINGSSTPKVESGGVKIVINATALSTVCIGSTNCNIPVILSGQNGNFESNIVIINNANAGKTLQINVANLVIGSYNLSVGNNTLPARVTFSALPFTIIANSIVNESALFTITPLTTGTINYSIVKPSGITLANNSVLVNLINSGTGASAGSANPVFGVATSFTNILAGNYSLATYGLADAKAGTYLSAINKTAVVSAGVVTNLGNLTFSQATPVTVPVNLNISGLDSSDTISIVPMDNNKYTYNQIIAANSNLPLKLINGESIAFNFILSTKYKPLNPINIIVSSGRVVNVNVEKPVAATGRIVGYFETWMATATWESATYSIAQIPTYVDILPLAFAKPDSTYIAGSYAFANAGLGIAATKDVAVGAIKIAQSKGQKVLLSVGGATYPNFAALNVTATMALVKDLGLDGIDLDYEADTPGCSNLNTAQLSCPTDTQMINIITNLRAGLDNIRPGMMLTAAVWSIGAYGTPAFPTTKYLPAGTKSALWVNPLKAVGNKFDALFLMSYDAGIYYDSSASSYPNDGKVYYDPLAALTAYKALYSGPVYQGIEVPPEAWGGNVLTPANAVKLVQSAAAKGAAGTMIWALQVQGSGYTANSFLNPICLIYNPGNTSLCNQQIPAH